MDINRGLVDCEVVEGIERSRRRVSLQTIEPDGWLEGCLLGLLDGLCVGCFEGWPVGLVGAALGCIDGWSVGRRLGWLDGCTEGCVDGRVDG